MYDFRELVVFLEHFKTGGICPTATVTINEHKVTASYYGSDLAFFSIDNKSYGEALNFDGSIWANDEEEAEIVSLLGEDLECVIATTSTGCDVKIDAETVDHLKAHSNLDFDVIKHAIEKTTYNGSPDGQFHKEVFTIDMGKSIGKSGIKTIEENDHPEWLYRVSREGKSHVIVNGKGDRTSKVFLVMGYVPEKGNYLFTASYGEEAPMEPWDSHLKEEDKPASIAFWETHAICVTEREIDRERRQ